MQVARNTPFIRLIKGQARAPQITDFRGLGNTCHRLTVSYATGHRLTVSYATGPHFYLWCVKNLMHLPKMIASTARSYKMTQMAIASTVRSYKIKPIAIASTTRSYKKNRRQRGIKTRSKYFLPII